MPPDLIDKLKKILLPRSYLDMAVDVKVPEIKHRAYYSETLASQAQEDEELKKNVSLGVISKWCLEWETKTNEFAPTVKDFPLVPLKNALMPPKDWDVYGHFAFPAQGYCPKLQFIKSDDPGVLSKGLLIDAKRREYASKYLPHILKDKYNITNASLTPAGTQETLPLDSSEEGKYNFLPLHLFDDETYEIRLPKEWVELATINGKWNPVPGLAFIRRIDNIPKRMYSLLKPKQRTLVIKKKGKKISQVRKSSQRGKRLVRSKSSTHSSKSKLKSKLTAKPSPVNIPKPITKTSSKSKKLSRNNKNLSKEKQREDLLEKIPFKWCKVAVVGYDVRNGKYHVVPVTSDNKIVYAVHRINLYFPAEDPEVFALRVNNAVCERDEAARSLAYNLFIDCIPLSGGHAFDFNAVNRLHKLTMCSKKIIERGFMLSKLKVEAILNYMKHFTEFTLRSLVTANPERYPFITLPKPVVYRRPAATHVHTGMKNYNEMKKQWSWITLYVIPETYFGMCYVESECLNLAKMSLFNTAYCKNLSLEEFELQQNNTINNTIKSLQIVWVPNIAHAVKMCLRDVGKGWFNVMESNWKIYEISKLHSMMNLIKFRMEAALKYLILKSITSFTNFVEAPCICTLGVAEDFVWGEDLINSQYKTHPVAIFLLVLKINSEQAFYNTNVFQFEKMLVNLFNTSILLSHKIPQSHPQILENLAFSEDLLLSSIGLQDPYVVKLRTRIELAYKFSIIPLIAYCKEYNRHSGLFSLDVDEYIEKFNSEDHPANEVKDEIALQFRLKENLQATIPMNIIIGPFQVNVDPLKQFLVSKRHEMATKLLITFSQRMKGSIEEAMVEYKKIHVKLCEKPVSVEQVFEIKDWMETIPVTVKTQEEIVKRLVLEYEILDAFWWPLEQDEFDAKWEALSWPGRISRKMEEVYEILELEMETFAKLEIDDEFSLNERLEQIHVNVVNLQLQTDMDKVHEIGNDVKKTWKMIKECQEFGQMLNQRQKLLGMTVTPFDTIKELIKEFEPYRNLWTTASDWVRSREIFMDNPLINVDGESIDRVVVEYYKNITKAIRTFGEIPGALAVATRIKSEIEEFRPLIPLIQAVRNPGLRKRHWEEFAAETGCQIVMSPTLTFNKCLELGIEKHLERMLEMADHAGKEYVIERSLDGMFSEWQNISLEIMAYKNTGTYIMKVTDDILQLLDDHIVMAQQLTFSPFKGAFEQRIQEWEDQLRLAQEVLDEWMECQKQWMYLEPIFTSEDITKQLPLESKKFNTMERTWRRVMKQASVNPNLMKICSDKRLLDAFKECNKLLEQVQKGLSDYLEMKRSVFPRFYFLSDDELLEILSQARNPRAVQPHLRKCFESIYKLTFEDDMKITQMYSIEGECVQLIPTMYPEGSVEYWLLKVEEVMKNSIRIHLKLSLDVIEQESRSVWVLNWPGQVVIAGCQTYWTAHVEAGIRDNKLKNYLKTMLKQLDGLRGLVKGHLSRVERQVLSALIVIEVHARDVLMNLITVQVKNVNEFDWISQLRYYWVDEQLKVRAVNAEFSYGYEYLGNSGRLVITPLTDRCYLTLTGALHLKFGGAPAGPAGTGKTETTKDLAKAFAIQCVVFNCSDQLDFMAMGKFFKGLASSGAWACFDEFNRIDIEVLSVVAQQITTIQKAQMARLDRFFFEGSEIRLNPACAVFITMNPGYAGRTELPDNLKALFRPVAMMVPDYTLIAEISLFSFGFSDAKQLAGKITTTFKLSSEQLSSQDHYDFGMRAVKTVIAVAGNLKRENPEMDERQIVLRSLRDVNVPKFLRDDLKLFNGIVSDLFPRMEELKVDYGELEESIRKVIIGKGLEDVDAYVKKVIQLYETTVVRHGLMLVGPTGSGKTKCYEILKDAMTKLKGNPTPSGGTFEEVHTYVLNPKSITMGQLYGEFDLLTHEWTDGILPTLMRMGVAATDPDKRWYVFDGPVDAVWIENMNTVLDDNKKLCLVSGEILKMTEAQTMMFEVADLAVASPATVSRCGMVYLEPSVLGLQPFLNCWLQTIPKLAQPYAETLKEIFERYLPPAIEFLHTSLNEIVKQVDSAIFFTCLHLVDCFMRPLTYPDGKPVPAAPYLALIPGLLLPWVVFAVIWSVGGTCDHPSRVLFSAWLRDRMTSFEDQPYFPPEGIVYDYRLHDGGFTLIPGEDNDPSPPTWLPWMYNMEPYEITNEMKYSDIEVPTVDNVRNAYILGDLLLNEFNVLCVGPTGSGKTVTIMSKLSRNMHKKFISDFLNFSARTSANQTQDLIDSKMDRRRKGVFGPPLMKRLVIFIDDLNMPALDTYGAQPPLELIRQWMDFHGWYDRKIIGEFRNIIDVNFVAAMGPPGGGRNPVSARLLRHFHFISFTEMQEDSQKSIFGTILKFWLSKNESLAPLEDMLLSVTLNVYSTILKELLPTPAKTHYTFNLRDLSKVFQGMLMCVPESMAEQKDLLRLWYHENCRVFQDRLVNDVDRLWFDSLLRNHLSEDFGSEPDVVIGDGPVLYGDFTSGGDVKLYQPITDMVKLSKILDEYLDEYNNNTTAPMKLVLFLDAIAHVCRISRVIRQPLGNALLLGMGGSGRQSLTRLATHMAEFHCFQVELTKSYSNSDWREDIKQLMLKAGLYNRETVFLFSDTQIKSESFLEDLNNVLNSGDVPNIYQADELDKIYQGLRGAVTEAGLPATRSNLYSFYLKMVRSNLHCVVTMSPIGEVFRARLRQFPALVNCCTIDWFSEWPESALQSVALQFLDDVPDLVVSPEVLKGIVVTFQFMHQSVVDASILYLQELSRHNYVTPTSYLELLSSYGSMMARKKGELQQGIKRLQTGLDKLLSTAEVVKVLQKELTEMKPQLEAAQVAAEQMLKMIEADRAVAEETRAVVEVQESDAAKIAAETQAIADDAAADLEQAMPMLRAAEDSLKSLNKNDITEVKALKRPPAGVILVMEVICIVKDIKPNKLPGAMPGEKILDYWEPGRNMLSDPGAFLNSLMNYDRENMSEALINKLKPYINNPDFQPTKIITVSKACTSLCMWVHAIYKFYFVNQAVVPKKAALAKAKDRLAEVMAVLENARAKMKEVLDGLAELEKALQETLDHKHQLEANAKLCEDRMNRAFRLIGGLSDERERWIQTIANFEHSVINVIGDILISAGAVAYLTPFTDNYRRGLLSEWLKKLQEMEVPHTEKCSPVTTLGEPVVIRKWQLEGLPRDYLSTENAILVFNSRRWPLFIDPQGQANRWVKNMGKSSGLTVSKLTDRDLIRTIESAVRFGKEVLIENVLEELDPALDPILTKQVYIQSNQPVIKIGDSVVPYNSDFRLYITTKLRNPHYLPEVSIKVLLVNFTLVPSGLQDQLLALVVMQERPDLEEERSMIVVSSAQMKFELKQIEDRILHRLTASQGSPVDDIDLIVTLEASKVKSEEIKIKVEEAESTEANIETTRCLYIPVAKRAQILFFCLADLALIEPMYQYSLEWFITIFINSMINTEKSGEIEERILVINEHFTFSLFTNVCRSLFEKNKLQFAFLLCVRIMLDSDLINTNEWMFFLSGGTPSKDLPNPAPGWLSIRSWREILSLENLPVFENFAQTFSNSVNHYKQIFDSEEPHRKPLAKEWETKLDLFQHLLVLKCLRPDKVTNGMQDFLTKHLGSRFIEPQTSDLIAMYQESQCNVPLIFVLSPGTDPAADLYKFADKMKMSKRMLSISLGQGQGPVAEKMFIQSGEVGNWVFFQNCHLAPSWMPRLEYLIDNISLDTTHRDFRIWVTSSPTPSFPASILQNGSKMTVEPPRGIKANMLRAYTGQVMEYLDFIGSDSPKVPVFKWLLFSLCLFHGVCLERRKFGPLGFNIPYEFTDGDLRICISQLHMFLNEYSDVPFKVLSYTAGQINYGGRVTDDWDRRCIMNILGDYYKPDVVNGEYKFDDSNTYRQMAEGTELVDYIAYIKTLPVNDSPSLFGLHSNADITCAQAETYSCLSVLLSLQPRIVGSTATSQEDVTFNMAQSIIDQVPKPKGKDEIGEIQERYPVMYEESLNTVLVQEVIRFDRLLKIVHSSLEDLKKALKGLVVMSDALEKMSNSLFTNIVPKLWANMAYPSLKPLGAWVSDLQARIDFINKWINGGIPPSFWISGFYFPQAFLTGCLQNYARKFVVAIDSINYRFEILRTQPKTRPEDGCVIYGLFLEGSRWNPDLKKLDESHPKELYTDMPPIWLIPEQNHSIAEKGVYECPVYKTLTRAGVLSTTGHSTNYVLAIEVPSEQPQTHWIKRGVALICALDF